MFNYPKSFFNGLLNPNEIPAIARFYLPDADKNSVEAVTRAALISNGYIATIENVINRARHESRKAGRARVTFPDIQKAMKNYIVPSDKALAQVATAGAPRAARPPRPALTAQAAVTTPEVPPSTARRAIAPATQTTPINRLAADAVL